MSDPGATDSARSRTAGEAPAVGATVAAVDCGSNSTRLLVLDEQGGQLARVMRITRLGKGVDATGMLDPSAIARTVTVLDEYRRILDDHGVGPVRVAATSAVRDASNGQEFLDAAGRAIGAPAELLSGEEEGRLAFAGATAGLAPGHELRVVVDIGGGSTELIAGVAGAPSTGPPGPSVGGAGAGGGVVSVVSLDVGCVRLTERCFHHDPPLAEERRACEEVIGAELERAARALPVLDRDVPGGRQLIGVAGTVSTLSMLDQGLTEYDWGCVHHSELGRSAVDRWCEILVGEPAASRAVRPGMVEGREDVIAAGALVLSGVMRRFEFVRCLVSETDILDGLACSLLAAPGPLSVS
ncbi:MAG TPA: Ppx/GppA phosphatase family protein [Acidimicrobiales bacterium]|nr:Ppx/GppA phosphatase family protein [Acidimicrobiales bacterium]